MSNTSKNDKDLYQKLLKDVLVIDLETVPMTESFENLSPVWQKLWEKKSRFYVKEGQTASDVFFDMAAIHAEFGQIVTIGVGKFYLNKSEEICLQVKPIASHNEKLILETFFELVENKLNPQTLRLVAHNGKEFDFPYLGRRYLANGMSIPKTIRSIQTKRPWEQNHLDTLELWKFGDYKNFTSLDLLAAVFGLTSSKTELDGSRVNHVYYHEKDLKRIADYCSLDVALTAQVLLKMWELPALPESRVKIMPFEPNV
ncbi:MAG: 3'-5' exonuclease [Cytophagales bacterium]|nr:MAG: 3'-5' exonuclease [Cytophagales bacterium]TAF59516.1 MAG: 3'-5' exonuclease [Cytophagales bacterium]